MCTSKTPSMINPFNFKSLLVCLIATTLFSSNAFSQDNVGIGTTTPHENAILDIESTDKGLLIPRLNTLQRLGVNPIANADGLLVYDTDLDQFYYWDGTQWVASTGPMGPTGPTGPMGPTGPAGANGATGPAGINGSTGPAGANGATGLTGAPGSPGATGATGANGANGATGPAGANGATGPAGANGATGPAGANGATGPTGANGATGPAGPAGPAGANGAVGPTGPAGPIDQVTGGVNNFFFASSVALVWELASTITVTTHGNNVLVSGSGWSTVFADWIGYRIMRDGAVVLTGSLPDAYLISGGQDDWGFGINGLDVGVPAGSHTYTFEVAVSDVPTFNGINEGFFQVAEINE